MTDRQTATADRQTGTADMPAVLLRDIQQTFALRDGSRLTALEDINLTIGAGEFVASSARRAVASRRCCASSAT